MIFLCNSVQKLHGSLSLFAPSKHPFLIETSQKQSKKTDLQLTLHCIVLRFLCPKVIIVKKSPQAHVFDREAVIQRASCSITVLHCRFDALQQITFLLFGTINSDLNAITEDINDKSGCRVKCLLVVFTSSNEKYQQHKRLHSL